MLKKTKSTKGVTLTALVVSIIVLSVLAGVSIAILIGENGILERVSKTVVLNQLTRNRRRS